MNLKKVYQENEKRLTDKLQEIKDSIYGLHQPFFKNFFDYDIESGYQYNHEKAHDLIESIVELRSTDNKQLAEAFPKFIKICLMYLLVACEADDWIYSSFLKLSETVKNPNPEYMTTFEILIDDEKEALHEKYGESFFQPYNEFIEEIQKIELDDFIKYTRFTIEQHIDKYKLNCLYSEAATYDIMSLMDDLSSKVNRRYLYQKRRRRL